MSKGESKVSIKVDCHTHSIFSPDAKNTIEEMKKRAQALGLRASAITEHFECISFRKKESYFTIEK